MTQRIEIVKLVYQLPAEPRGSLSAWQSREVTKFPAKPIDSAQNRAEMLRKSGIVRRVKEVA